MNYLFSRPSLRILESLSFTETLYGFDFDGTLAPIVEEPSSARMATETWDLFQRLADRVPVAVISGRSLADLAPRVPSTVRYLVGNHGLEGIPGASAIEDVQKLCADWKAELELLLQEKVGDPGVVLEDKTFSLALHYRNSRRKKSTRARILKAIEGLAGDPRIVMGKLVFNIVPTGGPHKGVALSRVLLHAGAKFGFFIGDDCTDEDVFSISDRRILTVRVGSHHASSAQYYIRTQKEIASLLRRLLKFHGIPE